MPKYNSNANSNKLKTITKIVKFLIYSNVARQGIRWFLKKRSHRNR